MARASGNSNAAVSGVPSGFQFMMPDVVIIDSFRVVDKQTGEPTDLMYLTVKSKDGGEVKFSTDQIPLSADENLFGQRVRIQGTMRGRRFGNEQVLATVGELSIGVVGSQTT